ncbi:MAG TPA: GNAT family N-acetyltransferase [Tepidisphaeraceae bacterium]|nr:GNAT family N-acetyltransferase [Tepidisphaeraceae bacterium]
MNAVHIRPATISDVPAIANFIRKLAEYEKLSHAVNVTDDLLRQHLFGAKPAAEVLMAELDGREIGYALFFQTYSTFVGRPGIWLEDLFVLPQYRGKGAGKALLTAVARIAAQRNCGRLEWSVLDWNSPAIEFYKSVGAFPLDDWTIFRMTGEKLNDYLR